MKIIEQEKEKEEDWRGRIAGLNKLVRVCLNEETSE